MPGYKTPIGSSAIHQHRPLKRATAKAGKRMGMGKKELADSRDLNHRPAKKRVARRGSGRTRHAGR